MLLSDAARRHREQQNAQQQVLGEVGHITSGPVIRRPFHCHVIRQSNTSVCAADTATSTLPVCHSLLVIQATCTVHRAVNVNH